MESPSGFSRDVVPVVTVLMTVIGYLPFTFSTVGLYNQFKTTSAMVCCERKPVTLINIYKIKWTIMEAKRKNFREAEGIPRRRNCKVCIGWLIVNKTFAVLHILRSPHSLYLREKSMFQGGSWIFLTRGGGGGGWINRGWCRCSFKNILKWIKRCRDMECYNFHRYSVKS